MSCETWTSRVTCMQRAWIPPFHYPFSGVVLLFPSKFQLISTTNCALLCSLMSFNNTVVAPHTFLRKDNGWWGLGLVCKWYQWYRLGFSHKFSLLHFWQYQRFPWNAIIMWSSSFHTSRYELKLFHARADASPTHRSTALMCPFTAATRATQSIHFASCSFSIRFQIFILCRVAYSTATLQL